MYLLFYFGLKNFWIELNLEKTEKYLHIKTLDILKQNK